jgi:prephenate dehydratase
MKEEAAIGSMNLSEIYGLNVLSRKVQNSQKNVTRFFLVKKRGKKFYFESKIKNKTDRKKTSLIFRARDLPGALYKTLGGFATNGVNLTKIESRPSQEKNFTYFFYIDFEGSLLDKSVVNSLDELRFFSKKIKILGTYPIEKN